jgi:hypothetical protein
VAGEIKLQCKLYAPDVQEAAGDMPPKWSGGLVNNAPTINDRRKASVPDDGTFNTKVAIPSNAGFSPMIDASFVSKSEHNAAMIKQLHYDNLKKAFGKWNDALDYAFETVDGVVAKRFKDAVASKQDNWAIAVAQKTLRITGDKVRGRGISPIAAYLLVGDPRAMSMLRPSDEWLNGTAYDIARTGERPALKAAVQMGLVQTGLAIISSDFDSAIITAQNAVLVTLLNGLKDTTKCDAFATPYNPTKSYIAWVKDVDTGKFYLHLQVYLTTAP